MSNPIFKISVLFLSCTLIIGCATQSQIRRADMGEAFIDGKTKHTMCKEEVKTNNSESYDVLNKIFLGNDDPKTLAKLSIKRKITEPERNALLILSEKEMRCRKMAIEGLSKVHFKFSSLVSKWHVENDTRMLKLLNEEITIGEYNKIQQEVINKRNEEWAYIAKQIDSELRAHHNTEIADRMRRQRAVYNAQRSNTNAYDAATAPMRELLKEQSRNRSTQSHTRCYKMGDYLNCDTTTR